MDNFYYINGNSYLKRDIAALTWTEYIDFSTKQLPRKLYKFFPNTIDSKSNRNYSQESLKNNTVFLQSPLMFDDPYDSTLRIDEMQFHKERLKYYANLCGFHYDQAWDTSRIIREFGLFLFPHIKKMDEWEHIFRLGESKDDTINKSHELFALKLYNSIVKNLQDPNVLQIAFYQSLHEEFSLQQQSLIQEFRVSCFTTDPFSMLMWAHYGNSHKGFCIEYELPFPNESNVGILQSILPVIYSDERINIIDILIADLKDPIVTEETVGAIYKYGLLTKSVDWKYQNEWRLISLANMFTDEAHNCVFFPISKVYIGAKMSKENREEIIRICDDIDVPSTCMLPKINSFSMGECTQKYHNPNCSYRK